MHYRVFWVIEPGHLVANHGAVRRHAQPPRQPLPAERPRHVLQQLRIRVHILKINDKSRNVLCVRACVVELGGRVGWLGGDWVGREIGGGRSMHPPLQSILVPIPSYPSTHRGTLSIIEGGRGREGGAPAPRALAGNVSTAPRLPRGLYTHTLAANSPPTETRARRRGLCGCL